MQLTVPTTMKETATIKGVRCGDFLIHRPPSVFAVSWHVTHIASGMRFPCDFSTKAQGIRFAREVKDLADWKSVQCGMPPDGYDHKAVWRNGEPTKEQKIAVRNLMKKYSELPSGDAKRGND